MAEGQGQVCQQGVRGEGARGAEGPQLVDVLLEAEWMGVWRVYDI